jgi:hypothetical protein
MLVALVLAAGCAIVPPGGESSAPVPPASSPPQPSPAPTSGGQPQEWPNEDNTGVPPGTELTDYTGDCAITVPGTVIDAKTVNCDLSIRATGVKISRSVINGNVIVRRPADGFEFTITDSEVYVGERLVTGLGNGNFTALRVEIVGGGRSAYCQAYCTIESSYVHGQSGDPDGEAHLSGIRMGQHTTLRFNTITCEGKRIPPASGCSAGLTGYGDFAPIQDNLIEGNIFLGGTSSFCAFGGSSRDKPYSNDARDIRFLNNVFVRGETGKCGILAPIEAFDSNAPGNVWEGNTWEDGEPLPPRN